MNTRSWKKGEVIAAIAVLLLSALFLAGTANALEPQKGDMRFVLIYNDVTTHDSDFLSGITVSLFDMDGNFVSSAESSSSGVVTFNDVTYGNYAIKTDGEVKGVYFYSKAYETVKFASNGLYTLDNDPFWQLSVDRYALSNELNITLNKGGSPIEGTVLIYFQNTEIAQALVQDYALFHVPTGNVTIEVIYVDGGVTKSIYKEIEVTGDMNVSIDVDDTYKIWGIVEDSATGMPVSTDVHITLINKTTEEFKILNFPGGPFSFYLASLNYKVMITADGYGIATYDASDLYSSSGPNRIELDEVTNNVSYTLNISSNLQWINLTYVMDITNETILYSLPYNDTGVLYYQLKFLGLDNNYLEKYFRNSVMNYTDKLITLDGNVYELDNFTSDWNSTDAANEQFQVTITASYKNGEITKESLLKDGSIKLNLYGKVDSYKGAKMVYRYTINLPDYLERSNDVEIAAVDGYINTVTVEKVEESPVVIVLKERKSPDMRIDPMHFKFGWSDMRDVNYVVNQSIENYTVVVPSSTDVWFNASEVAYDVVRDLVDAENTIFTWIVDGTTVADGKGIYNITHSFSTGNHTLQLKVEDVGENTNVTNITVLGDAYWPTVNLVIEYPSGEVVANVSMGENLKTIHYEINGTDGTVSINNGTAIIPVTLEYNETQEIIYDATKSYDTYDGSKKVLLPLDVEWDFNGEKSTGMNKTYAFDKPTRDGTYTINVTFRDAVNNTVVISFKVIVKDITEPVAKVNITVDGKETTEVKEGENITFDASGSYDPDNGTITSYTWTIKNDKYEVVDSTEGVYEILNGTLSSEKLTLKFKEFGTYYVILNITDADGNYKVYNQSIRVTPVRPDLAVSDVEIKGDRVEGSPITFVVNITNNGNKNASVYYIIILVDDKEVVNETFYNLSAGSSAVNNVTWTFSGPNNYSVTIKVYAPDEPGSYTSDNEKKMNINIEQAPWKTPVLVIGIIAIIIVLGYIGWMAQKKKLLKGKFTKKTKEKKGKK